MVLLRMLRGQVKALIVVVVRICGKEGKAL